MLSIYCNPFVHMTHMPVLSTWTEYSAPTVFWAATTLQVQYHHRSLSWKWLLCLIWAPTNYMEQIHNPYATFFFLEYAGELCIFVLRRRKDPITETISPLGSEREGDKTLLGLLQTNAGPDQIHMQPYKPQRTSCTLFLHSIYSWMMYYCSNSRPVWYVWKIVATVVIQSDAILCLPIPPGAPWVSIISRENLGGGSICDCLWCDQIAP